MRVALRWVGYLLAGLIFLILITAAAVWLISARQLNERLEAKPERLAPHQASLKSV